MAEEREYQMNDKEGKSKNRFSYKNFFLIQITTVLVFAAGVAGGICIGIYAYHGGTTDNSGSTDCSTQSQVYQTTGENTNQCEISECPNTDPVTSRRYEDTLYAPITPAEMEKTARFLLDQGVVSTVETPSNLKENFLLHVNLFPPVKTEALEFLDNGGATPKRYAKVNVQRGAIPIPDVMQYKIGPLDGETMTIEPLTQPGEIHFNTRPYEGIESDFLTALLTPELEILAPILAESFDGTQHPRDTYINFFNGPPSTSGTERNIRYRLCSNNVSLICVTGIKVKSNMSIVGKLLHLNIIP